MHVGFLQENMKESDSLEGLGLIRFPFYLDIHFNIILVYTCSSSKRFLLPFPTKTQHAFLFSSMRATSPAHQILRDLLTLNLIMKHCSPLGFDRLQSSGLLAAFRRNIPFPSACKKSIGSSEPWQQRTKRYVVIARNITYLLLLKREYYTKNC